MALRDSEFGIGLSRTFVPRVLKGSPEEVLRADS